MSDIDVHRITSWLVARGLAGTLETDLVQGFCTECRREDLQLSRAVAFIDTLHPVHAGGAFRWRNDGHEESPFVENGRTNEGEAAARWQRTPFYRLVTTAGWTHGRGTGGQRGQPHRRHLPIGRPARGAVVGVRVAGARGESGVTRPLCAARRRPRARAVHPRTRRAVMTRIEAPPMTWLTRIGVAVPGGTSRRYLANSSAWALKDQRRQCEGWQVVAPAGFEPALWP